MISGERLQDHWSSGYYMLGGNLGSLLYGDVSVMNVCFIITFYSIKILSTIFSEVAAMFPLRKRAHAI